MRRRRDSVDSLQRDHDYMAKAGQEVLRNIQLWRDGELTGGMLVNGGRAYVEHMYEHMNSEEKLVFPQIEGVLSAAGLGGTGAGRPAAPGGRPGFWPAGAARVPQYGAQAAQQCAARG